MMPMIFPVIISDSSCKVAERASSAEVLKARGSEGRGVVEKKPQQRPKQKENSSLCVFHGVEQKESRNPLMMVLPLNQLSEN